MSYCDATTYVALLPSAASVSSVAQCSVFLWGRVARPQNACALFNTSRHHCLSSPFPHPLCSLRQELFVCRSVRAARAQSTLGIIRRRMKKIPALVGATHAPAISIVRNSRAIATHELATPRRLASTVRDCRLHEAPRKERGLPRKSQRNAKPTEHNRRIRSYATWWPNFMAQLCESKRAARPRVQPARARPRCRCSSRTR